MLPSFAPAGEVLLFRQKDPKPLTPRPASSDKTNAVHGRAGQLAVLKQGPPVDGSVRLWDRAAGAGQRRGDPDKQTLGIFWNYYRDEGCEDTFRFGENREGRLMKIEVGFNFY